MNKEYLIKVATRLIENSEENFISEEIALSKDVVGMKIFDEPIFGFADADDYLFDTLRELPAIGQHFMLPKQWLPQAKTVISFFLPFSEAVRKGNKTEKVWPSKEWLHARIEGQTFLFELSKTLQSELINAEYISVVPSLDERFWSKKHYNEKTEHPTASFTSNWSERHIAFVCGLGTFGLSKGLITERGTAGRFGSIITDLHITPDKRKYKNVYEYCTMCGWCATNCPVNALSIEEGKNDVKCCNFIDKTRDRFNPRYGCGKCQVGVPCEYIKPISTS